MVFNFSGMYYLVKKCLAWSSQGNFASPCPIFQQIIHTFYLRIYRDAYTNVGDSEYPGGTTVYCTSSARVSDVQGQMPEDFWSNVAYTTGTGSGRYAQRESIFR